MHVLKLHCMSSLDKSSFVLGNELYMGRVF